MGRIKPVAASLTPPATYDYSYTWNATASEQYLNVNGVDSIPLYTRTADGGHYDYVSTFNVINGLDVTMDFQRSNTAWQSSGTFYKPDENKIGSDGTVGTIQSKYSLTYSNQTNKNYLLYFDASSTGLHYVSIEINNTSIYGEFGGLRITNTMNQLYIPSYSTFEIFSISTPSARYFDAWYLKDLGVSASYDAGYDAGYEQGDIDGYADGLNNNPNILLSGFQAMVGILVNFMLMIVNLEVFGVSILSVFSILALFVGIIWILKIIRG
jgi:hypothetical protein